MSSYNTRRSVPSYTPTVLIGRSQRPLMAAVIQGLVTEGWDVRQLANGDGDSVSSPRTLPAGARSAVLPGHSPEASELIEAARLIQPDVLVVSGTEEDPWAFNTIRELRSDVLTCDVGMVAFPNISVPEDMDITPMSGSDAWVFLDARPAQALNIIRKTVQSAMDGRLEWAQRDWTPVDRRHHAIQSLRLRVETGRAIDPEEMAAMLFGRETVVDVRWWGEGSMHGPGWRFGGDGRYGRPLLVRCHEMNVDEHGLGERIFTLFSRSGRLLLAASHGIAELAGGWPTLEV